MKREDFLSAPAGFLRRGGGRKLFLFLDFDGTLSAIRRRPGDAALPSGTRKLLERLNSRRDVKLVFITGRSLADIKRRVGIRGAVYAANHGFEIRGGGVEFSVEGLAGARRAMKALDRSLNAGLSGIRGAIVENKGATISVHYRMTPPSKVREMMDLIRSAVRPYEEDGILAVGGGKKVVEIRPAVDWDKGKAVLHILEVFSGGKGQVPEAVYIGDDRTDEDAFRALRGRGFTVHVGGGRTAAMYSVDGTGGVAAFLRRLVKALESGEA